MARHFTWEQASRLLPEVGRLLREAVEASSLHHESEAALSTLQTRIQTMGGVTVDRASVHQLRESRNAAAQKMSHSLESIAELGVQVKDLHTGLVDFPSLYRGREVLLCWRLGEPGIEYWHGLEDGYRGRKRIDTAFREQLRGNEEQ